MNGGGDTPTLKTRFKLRPAANSAPGSVLCDNYGRLLLFTQDNTDCAIAVVNGVATLASNVRNSVYKESYFGFGTNQITPVIAESTYTFSLDAIFNFDAEELTVNIGQPLTEVGNYVAPSTKYYWRPAGTSKILCDSAGKILICTWGDEKTRQQVIDDDGDFGSITLGNGATNYIANETWIDADYYSQRSQLLGDYDFVIVKESEYNTDENFTLLFPDGSIVTAIGIGADQGRNPESFQDYVTP